MNFEGVVKLIRGCFDFCCGDNGKNGHRDDFFSLSTSRLPYRRKITLNISWHIIRSQHEYYRGVYSTTSDKQLNVSSTKEVWQQCCHWKISKNSFPRVIFSSGFNSWFTFVSLFASISMTRAIVNWRRFQWMRRCQFSTNRHF